MDCANHGMAHWSINTCCRHHHSGNCFQMQKDWLQSYATDSPPTTIPKPESPASATTQPTASTSRKFFEQNRLNIVKRRRVMTDDTIHRRKRKNFYFYRLIYLLYPRPIFMPYFRLLCYRLYLWIRPGKQWRGKWRARRTEFPADLVTYCARQMTHFLPFIRQRLPCTKHSIQYNTLSQESFCHVFVQVLSKFQHRIKIISFF